VFDGRCFVRLDSRVSKMFDAGMRTTLAHRFALRAWTNGECLATKHHQTLFGNQTFYRLDTLFGAV